MYKKLLAAMLAACLCVALFSGCSAREGDEESVSEPENESETDEDAPAANNANITDEDVDLIQFAASASDPVAVIKTTEGDIRVRLFPSEAPLAVDNFRTLAKEGFYNGLTFHEVIADNLIRTGDPEGDGTGGESSFATDADPSGYFEDEFSLNLWHFRGALSMWSDGENRNSTQFYIVQNSAISEVTLGEMRDGNFPTKVIEKYEEVGGLPAKDWRNTVFGMVADEESLEVLDRIAAVPVEDADTGKYTPVDPVLIESITFEGDEDESDSGQSQSTPASGADESTAADESAA